MARIALGVIAIVANGLFLSTGSAFAASSPVARWALDAGSGDSVADSVGSADGTRAGGASWITSGAAVGSGAIHFDGVDGHIDVPSAASLEPAQLSISAWVRGSAASPPTDGQVIVQKGDFGCAGPSYGISVASTGIRFSMRMQAGDQVSAILTAADAKVTLWDGAWHLVTAHARISSNAVIGTASIDGSLMVNPFIQYQPGPQMSSVALYSGETTNALGIGANPNAACSGTAFHGDVDDVRVYSDPFLDPGSLMPPINVTISGAGPTSAHAGEVIQYVAHWSPIPAWANIRFEQLYNGQWQTIGFATTLDPSGDVSMTGIAPYTIGTTKMRAILVGASQYVSSGQEFDMQVSAWPSTTSLAITPSPTSPFQDETLKAIVTSNMPSFGQWPEGSVEFYDTTGVTPVLLQTVAVSHAIIGTSQAVLHVSNLDIGTHHFVAKYIGPDEFRSGSQSADTQLVVGKAKTTVSGYQVIGGPVEANHSFQLSAHVDSPNNYWAASATITFRRVGTSTPICVVAVNASNDTRCTVPAQPIGNPQFTFTYSGNTRNLASTSAPITVSVVPDVVHASGISLQYTTFYPVKDSYKDTVAIKGTRGETASVTIKIYSPGGTLLKTVSIASGTGAYSYAWNGRKSDGTIYAEGKYKVVQTLKDSAGTTLTSTLYTTLSKKKMYTYSKTITKLGSSLTAKGSANGGTVSINTTSGYVKLYAPTIYTSWAGAGWELTLPAATVYNSVYVRVYGRHSGIGGDTHVGAQNFATCAYVATATWYDSCFSAWKTIDPTSGTTLYYYKTATLSSSYRSGTKVRVLVTSTGGTTYIYKAQVVVSYGVLKY